MPGATAVGIAYKDGVIMGAERRITLGNFVRSKSGKKVFKVTDSVGAVCAGMVADMQNLVKEVSVYSKLKELESRRSMRPNSVAKLMSTLMFQNRYAPLLTQVILGGIGDKPVVFVLDPLGSVISDQYATVGTGEETAIGVIEAGYDPNMTQKEARDLAVLAIKAAVARDAMSGNGIDILTVDKTGIKEEGIDL
ncbi:MAG: proteasome subunit beta [Nitrososphaerota archaeon]|nr:proteasome subunit beta [Nitrososphaerota archaeon]MDG6912044.1 proteasome subunit beta [Nitrososphaerota archaeon]MDG6924776.1 proteasome subunit beta [Nitrososphaerota archaeon]MDG6940861.1 proteasome subunit beta [Nitrososphaerota archaeon]MDG6945168.1 proteasome subunit beta [Nitrososphaerota archaeon]